MARDSERDEVREALTHMSRTAGRMLAFDCLNRPNDMWAMCHERINALLDELEC